MDDFERRFAGPACLAKYLEFRWFAFPAAHKEKEDAHSGGGCGGATPATATTVRHGMPFLRRNLSFVREAQEGGARRMRRRRPGPCFNRGSTSGGTVSTLSLLSQSCPSQGGLFATSVGGGGGGGSGPFAAKSHAATNTYTGNGSSVVYDEMVVVVGGGLGGEGGGGGDLANAITAVQGGGSGTGDSTSSSSSSSSTSSSDADSDGRRKKVGKFEGAGSKAQSLCRTVEDDREQGLGGSRRRQRPIDDASLPSKKKRKNGAVGGKSSRSSSPPPPPPPADGTSTAAATAGGRRGRCRQPPPSAASSASSRVVFFHYLYLEGDNIPAAQLEVRHDRRCPLCSLHVCTDLGLILHCRATHGGFLFDGVKDEDGSMHVVIRSDHRGGGVIASEPYEHLKRYLFIRSPKSHPRRRFGLCIPFVRLPAHRAATLDLNTRKKRVRLLHAIGAQEDAIKPFMRDDRVPIRQYYHSRTNLPMLEGDWNYDSDEEADEDWLLEMMDGLMDEFEDVSRKEKIFMKVWNRFIMSCTTISDRSLPSRCVAFIRAHSKELLKFDLRQNLLLHLVNLWDSSLLSSDHVSACMCDFDAIGVETEDGIDACPRPPAARNGTITKTTRPCKTISASSADNLQKKGTSPAASKKDKIVTSFETNGGNYRGQPHGVH